MARAAEADARAGPAAGIFGWRYGPERIDESELDAALALADLARAAGAVGCQIRRSRDGGRVDHSGEIPASDLAQRLQGLLYRYFTETRNMCIYVVLLKKCRGN